MIPEGKQRLVKDMLSREIRIPVEPKRIVSLVPSQTELLYALGLEERLVGQTIFCIHPQAHFKQAHKIGGTKRLQLDAIRRLQPDLIIGNKEENAKGQIESLMQELPVWMSDIFNLQDALHMIRAVGDITGTGAKAEAIAGDIETAFCKLPEHRTERILYLIWREPWMAAGKQTFIDDMIRAAGFSNVLKAVRYPELNAEEIRELQPDRIWLSSEPYPFAEKHIAELQALLPAARIQLVDGELFSWYGSRLVKSPAYFASLA
jgi:ABC-type Fe3+-hydroxamate transport system substrate-binding protein